MNDEVRDLLERLREVLEPRVGKNAAKLVLANLWQMREHGTRDADILAAAHKTFDAFARAPVQGSDFTAAEHKAIAWAAPRRLSFLGMRARFDKAARGLEEEEGRAVAHHADLLANAYGAGDEDFAIAVAWKNALLYRHHFVLGDVRGRNDPWPLEALSQAWRRHGPFADAVPVLVIPGHGLVVAEGYTPSADVLAPWEPRAFVLVPEEASGRRLHLEREDELKEFFRRVKPRLDASTAACLVHLALAPFAYFGKVQLDHALLVELEAEEEQISEGRATTSAASALLGIGPPAPVAALPELRFVVEPGGTAIVIGDGGRLDIS